MYKASGLAGCKRAILGFRAESFGVKGFEEYKVRGCPYTAAGLNPSILLLQAS